VQIGLVKNNKKTKNLVLDLDIWFTGHELAIDFEIMRIWIRFMPGRARVFGDWAWKMSVDGGERPWYGPTPANNT
jgi:hypothetical protein